MNNEQVQAPVLLIIFNRPQTLSIVFEKIRMAKPTKLYISADGPRFQNKNDEINCKKAREIVKEIDWECEVKYRFLDKNLGCGYGPSSAISWAFENEDRLIIIEDDCVPSISLFDYLNYCLEKYKDDTRIWLVSGQSNQENTKFFENSDYVFSHYGHSMGWATWKRCWSYFDIEMKGILEFIKIGGSKNIFFSKSEYKLFDRRFKKLSSNSNLKNHSWDIQFGFSIISNNGLSIVPAKNLTKHIGYEGTHFSSGVKNYELDVCENFHINKEPMFVIADREYDLFHFKNYIKKIFTKKPLIKRILHKVLKIAGNRK